MNKGKVIGLGILLIFVLLGILLIIEHLTFAKKNENAPWDDPTDSDYILNNKIIPPQLKEEALIALTHFPELKNEHIELIEEPALFPVASRPALFRMILPWVDRKYVIVISTRTFHTLRPIQYSNIPSDARIGILGHELAHTLYYKDKSALQILFAGFKYLFPEYRKKFEKEADSITIEHGLGDELYQWSVFLENKMKEHPDIKKSRFVFEDRYLKPHEIKKEMEEK